MAETNVTKETKGLKKLTGLRKREQIAQANKTVFLWVAGAGVVLSLGVALGQALVSQAIFNQKVINEKTATARTLSQNLETSKELKDNVNRLLANENLSKAKAKESDNALKVVLDALPTANEPLAFGSSLQLVLLPRSGVAIEGLTVGDSPAGAAADAAAAAEPAAGAGQIQFGFTATGNAGQIKDVFRVMEDSIRPIAATSFAIEGSDQSLKLTLQGYTSYQDAKTVTLQKKAVQP